MYGQQDYPISVKGVVVRAGKVLLQCVAREIEEETGWRVTHTGSGAVGRTPAGR